MSKNGKNGRADTPVPVEHAENTGRMSRTMLTAVEASGEIDTMSASAPDDLLDRIADKMVEKMGGGGGSPPSPPRKRDKQFLGIALGGWTKLAIGYLVAGIVFAVTWYFTVNRDLDDRPTFIEMDDAFSDVVDDHRERSHADTHIRIKALEKRKHEVDRWISAQDEVHKAQLDVLEDIKEDLNYLRRRRR